MGTHRRLRPPRRARVTALTLTAAAAVALTSQAAQAAPAGDSLKSAKAKVGMLFEDAEAATERFDGIREKQKELQKEVTTLQDRVAREQGELNQLRDQLGLLASAQYRSGGISPTVQLMLSSDPGDYLDKASVLDQLSSEQAQALRRLAAKMRSFDQQRAEAAAKLAELDKTRADLGKEKKDVQAKLAKAQKLYNSLSAAQKAAIEKEDARTTRSNERVILGNDPAASQRAAAALKAAETKLGDPYVWGATGPNSFDCSGLTSWAYAQAGVSIPRTSQEQTGIGTRVSLSRLKPGDLVFFYTDLHHVGLYAGNGMFIHAPRTGQSVKFDKISSLPFMFGVRV
jgi:peptidoglycan DL-endopeptidase CwlO